MDLRDILSKCDHTLLSPGVTWEEIRELCDDAVKYRTASVCVSPSYVKAVKEYVGDRMAVCTVIGFPHGASTAAAKCFESEDALRNGADEMDMVVNLGWVKDGKYDQVLEEIRLVRNSCEKKILKVIIETCLLTEEEKIRMCGIVSLSGADYIKTSTGFGKSGAVLEDVLLMKAHVASHVKIKAAGGISSLEDAENFLNAGASRLGTSRIVKIAKAAKTLFGAV